ncbi:MAG TPA: response regulator [Opitutaceae bacterium]
MARTLLVVDDNKSVRDALRYVLERRGYGTCLAESGPAALAVYEQEEIAGALIDVNMPGMNGLETCRLLVAQAAAKRRPLAVWMITGARTPELLKKSVEAGAVTLLGKPFNVPELFQQFDEKIGPPDTPSAQPTGATEPEPKPAASNPGPA